MTAGSAVPLELIEWVVAVLLLPVAGSLLVIAYRSGSLVRMLEVIGEQLKEMKQTDREHTKRLERHGERLAALEASRGGHTAPHPVADESSGPT